MRVLWRERNGPRPKYTVTVPACADCEEKFRAEESYFRNTIVALAGDEHPEAKALLEGKMGRGLRRNRAELADITHGFQRVFRPNAASGVLEPASTFQLDIPRLSSCVAKVVRGLFFCTRQRPLCTSYEVKVFVGDQFWKNPVITRWIDAMTPFGGYGDGDTVFAARTVKDNGDPSTSAWLLVFYGRVTFFALTCRRDALVAYGSARVSVV